MTTFIFIISYIGFLVLQTILISPYFVILYLFTSYILAFLVVILFYLLNLPIVLILPTKNRYKIYLMRSLAAFLNRCYLNLKIEVEGLENIPKEGAMVAYSNHKSYTDAFAIMHYFPRAITLTPKKSVLKIPFLRLWLRAYEVFPIDRNSAKETLKAMEAAIQTVKNGNTILLFPEGTIRDRNEEEITNAKPGSFRLVKEAEAGLLPIKIVGNNLVRRRWPKRTRRKIIIYPLIPFSVLRDLSTREIANLFMDVLNQKQIAVE